MTSFNVNFDCLKQYLVRIPSIDIQHKLDTFCSARTQVIIVIASIALAAFVLGLRVGKNLKNKIQVVAQNSPTKKAVFFEKEREKDAKKSENPVLTDRSADKTFKKTVADIALSAQKPEEFQPEENMLSAADPLTIHQVEKQMLSPKTLEDGNASPETKNEQGPNSEYKPDPEFPILLTPFPRQFSLSVPRDESPSQKVVIADYAKPLAVLEEDQTVISRYFEDGQIQVGTFNNAGDLDNGVEISRSRGNESFTHLTVSHNVYDDDGRFLTTEGTGVTVDFYTKETTFTKMDNKGKLLSSLKFNPESDMITTLNQRGQERKWTVINGKLNAK